ncbi:HNH endonuclease [Kibdelosporangium persicum]|uniref:HNH endonuclease n=1 Tax=Kibdelosporangium persicum TaxID=2698649 RepID=UPI0015672926
MLGAFNIGVNAASGSITPLCSYCRSNPAQAVDHVSSKSHGGDLTAGNTTPACTFCNSSKKDRIAPLNAPPSCNYKEWPPPWWPEWFTR